MVLPKFVRLKVRLQELGQTNSYVFVHRPPCIALFFRAAIQSPTRLFLSWSSMRSSKISTFFLSFTCSTTVYRSASASVKLLSSPGPGHRRQQALDTVRFPDHKSGSWVRSQSNRPRFEPLRHRTHVCALWNVKVIRDYEEHGGRICFSTGVIRTDSYFRG